MPGPVLGGLVLVALLGSVGGRRRRRQAPYPPPLALTVVGVGLFVLPPLAATFDYRYLLPAFQGRPPH